MFGFIADMAWWMWVLAVFGLYIYGAITNAKYTHMKRELDGLEQDSEEVAGCGMLWPILLIVDPSAVKGPLYPTLWMWGRFREEYPALKAARQMEEKHVVAVRKNQRERKRETNITKVVLEDVKADIKHAKHIAEMKAATDTLNDLRTKPSEITSRTLEPEPETETETSTDTWCVHHKLWFNSDDYSVHQFCDNR